MGNKNCWECYDCGKKNPCAMICPVGEGGPTYCPGTGRKCKWVNIEDHSLKEFGDGVVKNQ